MRQVNDRRTPATRWRSRRQQGVEPVGKACSPDVIDNHRVPARVRQGFLKRRRCGARPETGRNTGKIAQQACPGRPVDGRHHFPVDPASLLSRGFRRRGAMVAVQRVAQDGDRCTGCRKCLYQARRIQGVAAVKRRIGQEPRQPEDVHDDPGVVRRREVRAIDSFAEPPFFRILDVCTGLLPCCFRQRHVLLQPRGGLPFFARGQ